MTTRQWLWLAASTLAVASVDLATKAWASRALEDRDVNLRGPLDLRLGHNRGVAFSFLTDLPAAVIVIFTSFVVVALVVAVARGSAPLLPAGLVLGGAIGNLIDRIHNGSVVDMLHTTFWPTFNLADVAICAGAALWVLMSSRHGGPDKRSETVPAPLRHTDTRS